MNLIKSISGYFAKQSETRKLAADTSTKEKTKRYLEYVEKATARTRQDIAKWNTAQAMSHAYDPKNFALQLLFDDVELDALLTSQIQNRTQMVLGRPFQLVKEDGTADEEATKLLAANAATRALTALMMEAIFFGYNLVEIGLATDATGKLLFQTFPIPRPNVVPQTGFFYPDYSGDEKIPYREMKEFGTWILEFNTATRGLVNKAIPHVLFKRFAQSCWSELCEIYGIPPRVLSTNTQDNGMLRRAEKMMSDTGAAAWFIIDDTEKLNFATGTATDGAVYKNLISLCSNEISLLLSGAVIGQDTQHGNRSKEEALQQMLQNLVKADMALVEDWWNSIALPALAAIGIVPAGLRFAFEGAEDLEQLWKFTKESLDYFKVDPAWVKSKFGIEITAEREPSASTSGDNTKGKKLSAEDFFA